MFIFIALRKRHHITGNDDGTVATLVPFETNNILKIEEDIETGYATISYHSGRVIETIEPFNSFLEVFLSQGLLNILGEQSCRKISKQTDKFLLKHKL